MDAPSPIAKEGKEFSIVRLTLKEGDREMDAKKGRIPVAIEKVAEKMFRIKPSKPLEPGEYAICFEYSGMATGQVWEFAVNQP
jgi:hypothetical protein